MSEFKKKEKETEEIVESTPVEVINEFGRE